ncbi:glycosyl hydrolase family 95 catalytic domain-containing protein [Jiangella endophytica]|uniref:glycosyl hydrolase family 95 catalytic domain-containing protein n=1 Tax=Jiangella endophytica TaxID=1623398 RepID=UPI000E34531B|nr:glycoside hydrolase N-terminal domain-containing protein [Jiangella endophytica]
MRALHYRRPSRDWLDGLPLGDGRTGAMVLAAADGVRLQLNDGTAWSGSPASEHRRGRVDAATAAAARIEARRSLAAGRAVAAERALQALQARYAQAYLPFADVEVRHVPAGDVERTLDLADAVHVASAGRIRHETFVSAADRVLVHQLTAAEPVDLTIAVTTPLRELGREVAAGRVRLRLALPADVAPGHEPGEPPLRWHLEGVDPVQGAAVVGIVHDGSPGDEGLGVRGVRSLRLVVATATTFTAAGRPPDGTADDAARAAEDRVAAALSHDLEELRSRHVVAHRELYDRTALHLDVPGDPAGAVAGVLTDPDRRVAELGPDATADPALLEALFDYGRYLLVSSSRPGGLPATLQGLWNEQLQPPWSSAYTLNINTEMNYWAAGPLGLPETEQPLLDLVEALAERGAETAARLYGAGGWTTHHNTDAWAFTAPTSGDASWSQWPTGGAWMVCQLDRRRRFGAADRAWLERFWPLAAGAAEFVLDLLEPGDDGHLATFPSTSPENRYATPDGPAALTTGSGMDRALAAELFSLVGDVAAELGRTDHPVVARAAAAGRRLRPPVVSAGGTVQEWHPGAADVEPHHRHLSHLVFAYPGGTELDDELAAAVARTLDARGDDSTGWSLAWKLALRARLHDGERFGALLRYLVRPATDGAAHAGGLYANLFAAHPPFQIDGNLGYTAAVCEALVQGHRGVIDLLPGWPAALGAGSVRGLVAEPGISVDLAWHDGVPVTVTLHALGPRQAGPRLVRHGATSRLVDVAADHPVTVDWDRSPGTTPTQEQ